VVEGDAVSDSSAVEGVSTAAAGSLVSGKSETSGRVADSASAYRTWPAEDLTCRIERVLRAAATELSTDLARVDPRLTELGDVVMPLVTGGKHLRPTFGYWGWRGAGGPDCPEIVSTMAALDLLHAFALVHDDVVDDSELRRGLPAVHVRFANRHRAAGWAGDPVAFGRAMAILVGDLLLVWADRLLANGGLPGANVWRGRPVYDEMRIELMAGESLDVLDQAQRVRSLPAALRTARFKTGKYTIERPLHLGAMLARDTGLQLLDAYSGYGLPLGEAFQLRDDVLGVFGDPAATGKPAGDDLREGKRTVLIALAYERARPAQRLVLDGSLGDPDLAADGIDMLREIIVDTGALASTETMVESRARAALSALDCAPVATEVRTALAELAVRATRRTC
jgi:geranylgeranyl diphosphate synthase type I